MSFKDRQTLHGQSFEFNQVINYVPLCKDDCGIKRNRCKDRVSELTSSESTLGHKSAAHEPTTQTPSLSRQYVTVNPHRLKYANTSVCHVYFTLLMIRSIPPCNTDEKVVGGLLSEF